MSLQDYIKKKNENAKKCQLDIFYDAFLEQSGFAIYSLNFKSNKVFIENFLVNKDKKNIEPEEEANFINKIRFKQILDDKDILKLKENFGDYCIHHAEETKCYLEFLLRNYENIDAKIELLFDEHIFPEYNLDISFNNKHYICSYRLNDVKSVFDKFIEESNLPKLYNASSMFYVLVENSNIEIINDYIKKISWNLPDTFPKNVLLKSDINDCKIFKDTHKICEIKGSINDVFVNRENIHIINENFIPKRIRWIEI